MTRGTAKIWATKRRRRGVGSWVGAREGGGRGRRGRGFSREEGTRSVYYVGDGGEEYGRVRGWWKRDVGKRRRTLFAIHGRELEPADDVEEEAQGVA